MEYKDFTDNLELTSKFRWKEDPNQQEYTINGSVSSISKLRHSWNRNRTISDGNSPAVVNNMSVVSSSGLLLHSSEYINANNILNDNNYEYDEIGIPFLAEIGRLLTNYNIRQ